MLYRRSREIENRLQQIVGRLRFERHTTHSLARALETSEPTISRSISALRERGYVIRSVRDNSGWRYEIIAEPATLSEG
jgi:biotin operon repressor